MELHSVGATQTKTTQIVLHFSLIILLRQKSTKAVTRVLPFQIHLTPYLLLI